MKELKIRERTKKGYTLYKVGGAIDINYLNSKTRRGRVVSKGDLSGVITTDKVPHVIENITDLEDGVMVDIDGETYKIRIRKTTPKECLRLMDMEEENIDKLLAVNSNTQAYKQAGNSIVVNTMCAMFRNLNLKGVDTWNEYVEKNGLKYQDN